MSINFKAQYIMPATIQKRNKNHYQKHSAGFYKLDPQNKADKKIITEIAKNWGNNSYSYNIYYNLYNNNNLNKKTHVYVIAQDIIPEAELSAGNIIGIAELTEHSDMENTLDFMQVKPFILKTKKYLKTGSQMLDIIKCLHFDKPIYLFSDKNAREFYQKNGFQKIPNCSNSFYWEA